MFKQALLGTVLLLALPAYGTDLYFTAGIGQARLQHPGTNGWWIQEGFDYTIKEASTSYRLGFGAKVNKYLAIEANYHDLGQYNQFAGFIPDELNYDQSEPDLCIGECSPTKWAYLTGSAKAVSLSAIGHLPIGRTSSLFGRAGVAYFQAKFEMFASPYDSMSKKWETGFARFDQKGFTPLYGAGVKIGNITFEFTKFPGIQANGGACCSAFQSATVKTINYSWDFK